jgi:hypothetical protein
LFVFALQVLLCYGVEKQRFDVLRRALRSLSTLNAVKELSNAEDWLLMIFGCEAVATSGEVCANLIGKGAWIAGCKQRVYR